MRACRIQQSGFTLVEMITVMVITGILGAMVAVFIRAPVQGYVDSARRAEMTDAADTALRRLGRDIRTAVPNSMRVPSQECTATAVSPCYLEYLPTRDGGRYRANGPGNALNFDGVDSDFDIIGSQMNFAVSSCLNPVEYIVLGSTQSDGNPPYDRSPTGILRAVSNGVAGWKNTVSICAPLPLWAELQTQRFDVVDGAQQAVTYACENVATNTAGNGTGVLNRYSLYGYNLALASPATLVAGGAAPAVLVNNLSACTITYNQVSQSNGLLEFALTITRNNENVSLYHAIHVNNIP